MDSLSPQPPREKSRFNAMWLIAFALTGVLAYAGISRSLGGKEIIPWRDDFTAAQSEAKQTGKPMFLYFTADWCGPCQSMKRTTWANANVEQALRTYIPTRIDIDRDASLATQFQVTSVPFFVVLSDSGALLQSNAEGAMDGATFIDWLKLSADPH